MGERIPLFPLGTVVFPGLVLPLHIFEDRYRALVRDLLELPASERRFGIVAITLGHEVGAGAIRELADVGCAVDLREVEPYDDGRYDIVVAGQTRFRIDEIDESKSYREATVSFLGEELGAEADVFAGAVNVFFRGYRETLRSHGVSLPGELRLPDDDPIRLSHFVATSMILDRVDKQNLLEAEDAAARLRHEIELLRREVSLLKVVPALPLAGPLGGAVSAN